MVRFQDRRGRGYEVSMWDLPNQNRPAVRLIRRKERKTTNLSSSPEEEDKNNKDKGKGKAKAEAEAKPATSPKKEKRRVKAKSPNPKLGDWSEEQDAQLLKLKDEDGKRWLNVVVVMGKPKQLLLERYHQLKAKPGAEKSNNGSSSEDDPSQSSSTPSASSAAAALAASLDEDNWSATDPTDCITDMEPQSPVLEVGDKSLTMNEMRLAVRLNDYLEEQKWLFLASKLFDKTGKRFSPEALKQGLSEDDE